MILYNQKKKKQRIESPNEKSIPVASAGAAGAGVVACTAATEWATQGWATAATGWAAMGWATAWATQ